MHRMLVLMEPVMTSRENIVNQKNRLAAISPRREE